jgi:hypothetical protein
VHALTSRTTAAAAPAVAGQAFQKLLEIEDILERL